MPAENALQVSYGVSFNTETQFNDFKYAKNSATDLLGFDNGLRDMRSVVPAKRMVNDANNAAQISQVSCAGDDSFEWFGGNVNAKHLIAYHGWDDDFDTDNGFSGNLQFLLSVRNPRIADTFSSQLGTDNRQPAPWYR